MKRRTGDTHAAMLLVVGLLLVLAVACPASQTELNSTLQRAIDEYTQALDVVDRSERLRRFTDAEQLFRQVISELDSPNADLYVNLGNAALNAERPGPAIIAYRRALELDPTHTQARQNLGFARLLVPEMYRRESHSGLIDTLFFWTTLYARQQISGLAGISFLIAAIFFAGGLVRRRPLLRNLALLPLVCWLVLVVSTLVTPRDGSEQEAVVVADELLVHSADSENSAPRLSTPLTSGVEVVVLRQRDRWTEVELSGGRSGWVRSSGLELAASERL